jgi:hypothetical protein
VDDAPRWSAKTAVKKDDQFTAAPDFIDVHESEHLPMWGRIQASWHGMSRSGRVVVMASLALLATWGGTSAIYFLDDLDGVVGSPDPGSGLAAEDPQSPVDGLPSPSVDPAGLLNRTASPAPFSPAPSPLKP